MKDVPVIQATELGQIKAVKELLCHPDVDVNEKNSEKDTAVLVAARGNRLEILKLLIKAGACVDVQDALGNTPLDWANHNKNQDMIDLLSEAQSHEKGINYQGSR